MLLRGKLFAGALFAGALLGGHAPPVEAQPPIVSVQGGGSRVVVPAPPQPALVIMQGIASAEAFGIPAITWEEAVKTEPSLRARHAREEELLILRRS